MHSDTAAIWQQRIEARRFTNPSSRAGAGGRIGGLSRPYSREYTSLDHRYAPAPRECVVMGGGFAVMNVPHDALLSQTCLVSVRDVPLLDLQG